MLLLIIILLLLFAIYTKRKKLICFSLFFIFCIVSYVIYKKIFSIRKSTTIENFEFKFRNDAENVRESPEMYCGDSNVLPRKYDVAGTRYSCMKKGIGIGMNLPDENREEFLNKPRDTSSVKEKVYCGNDLLLPEGYARFGKRKECLQKGVGVGLAMPQEKRLKAQRKASPKLGKREIMELASRLKIDTDDLTRRQSIMRIANRLLQLNA